MTDYERRLAQWVEELNEFQRAMLDLDVALTGHAPTEVVKQMHHYPDTFEKWYTQVEHTIWYLSDGGYSRVVWSEENKNLFLTYNSRKEVFAAWDAALPQRQRAEEVILRHYRALGESIDPLGAPNPVRACADCEKEHGIINRSDTAKSHGHCRRHWIKFLVSAGQPPEEIADELTKMSSIAFCPDLGPHSAKS